MECQTLIKSIERSEIPKAKRFGPNQHIIAVRDRYLTRRSYASRNFAELGNEVKTYTEQKQVLEGIINERSE